jgi:Helix-turn-helix domain
MDDHDILMPSEAAAFFRVDERTLARWVNTGKLPQRCWFRTLGSEDKRGHLRYRRREILELMEELGHG